MRGRVQPVLRLGVLSLTGGTLPPEGSCTFSVALTVPVGSTPGTYPNTAGPVTGVVGGADEIGNSAGDLLFVVSFPVLSKTFTDDPVGAGNPVTLEFTITNPESTSTMSGIEFVDELTDGGGATGGFLPFPVSVSLPPSPNPPCGVSSSLDLVSLGTERQGLSLTGGSLAAAGSCTFSVTINIPTGQPSGTYTNTTGAISAVLDDAAGAPTVTGPPASGDLVVVAAPNLTKEFTDDPIVPGGTATLVFTLTHDEFAPADATGISFSDDLTALSPGIPGLIAASVDTNTCAGSTVDISTPTLISFSAGTLMAGESCSITISLSVPVGATSGFHTNETSAVTATVGGVAVTGNMAKDNLLVTGLLFSKEFTDDPVIAGDTVSLTFTLDNTSGAVDVTSISFADDLNAALTGLAETGMVSDTCNGSLSGTTFLSYSGGSVLAGASCSIDLTLTVPSSSADGTYTNVTSSLSNSLGTLPPAVDNLVIRSNLLTLSKAFIDDPVSPGDTVTLQFTLTNLSATDTVTSIAFVDDLDSVLSGLKATSASGNTCNGMSAFSFPTGLFEYDGGVLLPGESCVVTLLVAVPSAPPAGNVFLNTTTGVTGRVGVGDGGLDVFGDPASDNLRLKLINFSKSFDGPTTATGTAVLTFTIENLDTANAAIGLVFSDDLDAVLSGLEATGLPATPCGAGSSLTGTSFLTLTGASLAANGAAGDSCTFDVTVTVPASASAGTFVNTTSNLFQTGFTVADPAVANLTVEPAPAFAKSFAPDLVGVGLVSTLTFTIDNTASALAASSLEFTDNLPAAITVATPANTTNTCGGSLTASPATSVITLTGGIVSAGASCTLSVDVSSSIAGVHVNTSDDLTSSSGNSGTASDTLTVNPPPTFTKSFVPDEIFTGATSTLTFTIDNTGSTSEATILAFTDNLPVAVTVATPANDTSTCGGGLVATSGSSVIMLTNGTVSAASSCTIGVDVTSEIAGVYDNITDPLTSSLGDSGTASDTLTVFSKFQPVPVLDKFGLLLLILAMIGILVWRQTRIVKSRMSKRTV